MSNDLQLLFTKWYVCVMCFGSIYYNPGFSPEMDAMLETTSTFKQPEEEKTEVEQLHRQDSAAPNFGQTENTSSDVTTVVMNVSFVDEDSPVTETQPETDNLPAVDENSDTKSAGTDEISAPMDNDSDNGNEKSSASSSDVFADDVTGDDVTPLSAVESHREPVVSHPVLKKKSQEVRQQGSKTVLKIII